MYQSQLEYSAIRPISCLVAIMCLLNGVIILIILEKEEGDSNHKGVYQQLRLS